MQSTDLEKLLAAMAAQTEATNQQTAAINRLVESNAEVVDLLLGELGPDEVQSISEGPKYLGSR